MFYLIRCPVIGANDEYQDLDFDTDKISIGSDDNALIRLPGLRNGNLFFKAVTNKSAKFQCSKSLNIISNNKEISKGSLQAGLIYQLGSYDIEIIDPPSGFDFAIQIRNSNRKEQVNKKYLYLSETQSRFKFRSLSYLLMLTIVILFLMIPYQTRENNKLNQGLSKIGLPTDKSWISGPLAMAHHVPEIGDSCNSCHIKPFQKVADAQCLSCHKNIGDHVSQLHPASADFHELTCQNCHKEHNEPARITRTDDFLCIDCHEKIETFESQAKVSVEKVTGFTADSHPLFRLSLVKPIGNGASLGWEKVRPKYDDKIQISEQSNLKFSHKIHLDGEKVQNQLSSQALSCDSCHQLKQDGKQFEPISMDKDCRSCHLLSFDVFNPDLELPHGNLRSATVALEAHFIREFTDPDLRIKRAKIKPRRIPGKHMSSATCNGGGLECGKLEAFKEAEYQFTKTGCITCHNVLENSTNELHSNWFVQPIKINNDWYVKSHFDHKSHLSIRNDDEKGICLSCHQMDNSNDSSDIMIPQQDNCLECHQQDAKFSVELQCMQCHKYHFAENLIKAL